MDNSAKKYLEESFSDLLNYDAQDIFKSIDPITYLNPEGDSCLHIAAGRGNLRAVRLLLEAGLDVNLRGDLGNTPLHYAHKHSEIVRLLIEHGARLEVENDLGQKAGKK